MEGIGPILVVDDDESILDFVQMVLVDEGYEVILAMNGRQALEKLNGTSPGLILLDMRMPEMNGWQFAEEYRKKPGPHAPIVVLTATNDVSTAAADVGAHCHLGKPFDIDDLIEAVESCVSRGSS